MVMSIFIILRLVQCTCFALYVLWNKWSTVMVEWFFISKRSRGVHVAVWSFFTLPVNCSWNEESP